MKGNSAVIYVFIAIFSQSASLILAKFAALNSDGLGRYLNFWYLGSLFSLGIQALVWQQALKGLPLSVAYPMMSLVFAIIPLISFFAFNESLSWLQLIGTATIMFGTILIARGVGEGSNE